MTYSAVSELDFALSNLDHLPYPTQVVMTTPEHFKIEYEINPHMAGNIGTVDQDKALVDWITLKSTYEQCGMSVDVVPGKAGLPDMVFCANQTLPFIRKNSEEKGVVLSNMFAKQRAEEVQFFANYFGKKGYEIVDDLALGETEFEGMGDALWHLGRRMLWGGYGFRSDKSVYDLISDKLDVPVILLNLEDPEFYHLDTCMCILNERTVLIYPGAFKPEGLELIHHFFPVVLEAPEDESRTLFACNAHCPDQKHVLIQRGCKETNQMLIDEGFIVKELETDEYLKSGGSVFCMKLMTW